MMELTQKDLPDPVCPAIRRWGILAISPTRGLPSTSRPRARRSRVLASRNWGEFDHLPQPHRGDPGVGDLDPHHRAPRHRQLDAQGLGGEDQLQVGFEGLDLLHRDALGRLEQELRHPGPDAGVLDRHGDVEGPQGALDQAGLLGHLGLADLLRRGGGEDGGGGELPGDVGPGGGAEGGRLGGQGRAGGAEGDPPSRGAGRLGQLWRGGGEGRGRVRDPAGEGERRRAMRAAPQERKRPARRCAPPAARAPAIRPVTAAARERRRPDQVSPAQKARATLQAPRPVRPRAPPLRRARRRQAARLQPQRRPNPRRAKGTRRRAAPGAPNQVARVEPKRWPA